MDKLSDLKGVRLRIYCYILQQDSDVGVREVQRALRLKSASHASYHLTKLYESDIVDKTPSNRYQLREEYKQSSLKINVLTDYFLLAGRFWPRTVFYSTYLLVSLIIGLILVFIGNIMVLRIYLVISLVLSMVISIIEVYYQVKALPWEDSDQSE